MKAMFSFVRLSPRCGSDDQGIHVQHRLCDDMVDVKVEVDCPIAAAGSIWERMVLGSYVSLRRSLSLANRQQMDGGHQP